MTPPPNIVIFGGSSILIDRMERVTAVVGASRHIDLDVPLDKVIIDYEPALFVVNDYPTISEALTRLREVKERFRHTPVLVIARKLGRRDIVQAHRLGADEILLPPFEDEELAVVIQQLLQRRSSGPFAVFRRWRNAFRQWFTSRPDGNRAQPAPLLPPSPGIVSERMLPFFQEAPPATIGDLSIRFFGPFHISFFGKELPELPGKKITSLLAYLLFHHSRPVHREVLMAKFWGQSTPSSARNSLNVALHKIRRIFQAVDSQHDILVFHDELYQLNPALTIHTDVDEFSSLWKKGRMVERTEHLEAAISYYNKAIALYRGDFLESILFEEWCESERDNLKETYLFILNRLSDFFFQQEAYTVAISVCQKILARDPCLEETHRRLIICYDRLGMRDKAIRQYFRCEEALKEELSVRPSDQMRQLFAEISRR